MSIRLGDNTIETNATNERGQIGRVEFGDPARTGEYHPHVTIGWRPGGDSREDEPGILRIGLGDRLGVISKTLPTNDDLTIIGAKATARLYRARSHEIEFEVVLTAAQVAGFRAGTEIRVPFQVGGRGLTWAYQTPLVSPVDIGGGMIQGLEGGQTVTRPLLMDGGFCVYHATLRHDRRDRFGGLRAAGTGKICNVLRPVVIDVATGERFAGQWGMVVDELAATFPASWFVGRVGPFTVDPTFGYTTIGSSAAGITAGLSKANLSEAADATSVSFYGNLLGLSMKGLIYTNTSNYPDARKAVGSVVATNGLQWNTSTVTVSLTSGDYFIGGVNNWSDVLEHRYDSGQTGGITLYSVAHPPVPAYTSPEDPCPAGMSSLGTNMLWSAYVTYTATGGAGAAVTPGGEIHNWGTRGHFRRTIVA